MIAASSTYLVIMIQFDDASATNLLQNSTKVELV